MDSMNSVSITGGGYTAQISLLGGRLLDLRHHEDELIVSASDIKSTFSGAVLAPWPNRTRGGSYTHNGVEHMLTINEEATGAALHGLLFDLPLRVVSQKASEVQLAGWMESSEGYPFGLDIALTYRVSADIGLAATLMARYRPEELDEEANPGAETPSAKPDDEVLTSRDEEVDDLGTPDLEDDEAVGTGTDAFEDADLEADQGDGDSAAEQAADSDPSDGDATDTDLSDGDAPGVDATMDASADDEAVEHEIAASASEHQETSASDVAGVSDAETAATEATPAATVSRTAPFGAGFHPYLTAGGAPLGECRLRVPARTMLKTKADGTVTGRKAVTADFDLTHGPLLSGRTIDHAFTDLPAEGWTAELIHGPSGFVVRMIADSPWVQIYTGERIDRAGVAVEPMSCPPNALNSGEDLIHLEPGNWFRMGYSIEAIRAD